MKGQEQVIGYAQRHGDRLVCHNYHHSLVVCHLVVRLLQLSIDVDGVSQIHEQINYARMRMFAKSCSPYSFSLPPIRTKLLAQRRMPCWISISTMPP